MRGKKAAWIAYAQGLAILILIVLALQYLNPAPGDSDHPAASLVISPKAALAPSRLEIQSQQETQAPLPAALTPPCPPPQPRAVASQLSSEHEADNLKDGVVQPALLAQRQDLVAWINNVATQQELEALKLVRGTLVEGRDPVSVTRHLQSLRPLDGWIFCVLEGEVCECPSETTRYGDFEKDQWVERKSPKSPVLCHWSQYDLTAEDDISPGKIKFCQCRMTPGKCPDGNKPKAERCPGHGERACRAGCSPGKRLKTISESPLRANLCQGYKPNDLLWSCEPKRALRPRKNHRHSDAEEILQRATSKMCEDRETALELEVYLECDFLDQYLKWTSSDSGQSPWIEEAYVTYVGGHKDSNFEWQATNLVRSVDLFSKRPLVIVIFGEEFVPPQSWLSLRNLIVYRMRHISKGVSFNFNKVRSMIGARVLVGIQLDTDQLIFKGMDKVFEGTRREIHEHHPWPLLPVHWMSRDETPGNPYRHYAFKGWDGPQSMRWCHAHPTWTHWAIPWLTDLLHERMIAATGRRTSMKVWDLSQTRSSNTTLLDLIRKGEKAKLNRHVEMSAFMYEDEDMMNVNLWRHQVTKAWCKFDLEPNLFILRRSLTTNIYFDPKWYPDGMPLLFLSMHNTKSADPADWMLHILEACKDGAELDCPQSQREHLMPICKLGVHQERETRLNIYDYGSQVCCCLEPRWSHPVFWNGQWFTSLDAVPKKAHKTGQERPCIIP